MKTCKMCGQEMGWEKRWHAETCSANCRKAWSRRKDHIKRSKSNIMGELQSLRQMLKKYPDLADAINADLRYMQGEINDLLRLRPDDEQKALMDMLYDVARKKP
jgi:hypothetical protein